MGGKVRLRIIGVNQPDMLQAHGCIELPDRSRQPLTSMNRIARLKAMGGINAGAHGQLPTRSSQNFRQPFKIPTQSRSLTRSVFHQYHQSVQAAPRSGSLQRFDTSLNGPANSIAPRASRVGHEKISAQRQGSRDLTAESGNREFANYGVSGGEVDQVVVVHRDWSVTVSGPGF